MSATTALTTDLKRVVLVLEDDLRQRVDELADVAREWREEHRQALERGRTASAWGAWRDDRITQVAVSWVLTTVFVRFCEDNRLLGPVWISGPGDRHQEALDARNEYFRAHPEHTDREWLQQAISHLADVRATAALVDEHAPLHLVSPSGQAASDLVAFWWRRDESGRPVHDFRDEELSTRFLGDLYQDLSDHARDTYALLQTPVFVEEFILDRTLEPALLERPLEGFRMIDPTCGSGHFLLGTFSRMLDRWHRAAPAMEVQALVQMALDAVHGVDVNSFAVAIARFRLVVEALRACGLNSLERAPLFQVHLAVGDSLLHGSGQQTLREDEDLSQFSYTYENAVQLRKILEPHAYDLVVGNPPYIVVGDPAMNAEYRRRYSACKGAYPLSVPFMQRFFDLAAPAHDGVPSGWVGQITSNSFMRRSYGVKLIESFLPTVDLQMIIDSSGAYLPGHSTPTVILVGRSGRPRAATVRVLSGIAGEPAQPQRASEGRVWRSIIEHFDQPGWENEYVAVADLPRAVLASHPWNLVGSNVASITETIESATSRFPLKSILVDSGAVLLTRADPAYLAKRAFRDSRAAVYQPYLTGEDVRDWRALPSQHVLYPYGRSENDSAARLAAKLLWPNKLLLSQRVAFGKTQLERGLSWTEYSMFFTRRLAESSLRFADIATHFHVARGGGQLSGSHAPTLIFKSDDELQAAMEVLNSSTACFWLKQYSHCKGNATASSGMPDQSWSWNWEFTATTVASMPMAATRPTCFGERLDRLASRLSELNPSVIMSDGASGLGALAAAEIEEARVRASMVALQEESDWAMYRAYGLIDENLTYEEDDLPGIQPGERAFEIFLTQNVASSSSRAGWFEHHRMQPLNHVKPSWPPGYRDVVNRRLRLLKSHSALSVIESPDYKRRWASGSWVKRRSEALRLWLLDWLDKKEYWFDRQGRPLPQSISQLADRVEREAAFIHVLSAWAGQRDLPVAQALTSLLADEAVPYLAAHRFTEVGLRKRAVWEEAWSAQRREAAGGHIKVGAIPPKYIGADFRKAPYWAARGKLDVPKERFIAYPDGGRDADVTPLIGWGGWDYAQQSLALAIVIDAREQEGWGDQRLLPLVAGLAELQPWVEQWHSEIDPDLGLSLASYCASHLAERMAQIGATLADLTAWRPQPATRGRKPRKAIS